MLKRFSHFFVCLLLLLLPLQGVAAANMTICNSIMQPGAQKVMNNMPCHGNIYNNAQHTEKPVAEKPSAEKHTGKSTCKTYCTALCASLNAMTALPSMTPATTFLVSTQTVNFSQQVYVSITQPSLQRPPILLS